MKNSLSGFVDEKALFKMSYGLYIITARTGDNKKNGQICNVAAQVTAEPLQIAVVIHKENLTYEYIRQGGAFGLSILEQATPFGFIGTWGFKSGRDIDKFAQAGYKPGKAGTPLLTDHALAVIECKVTAEMDIGTHMLFMGGVIASEVLTDGTALTYEYYRTVIKGKVPKRAPTYRADD